VYYSTANPESWKTKTKRDKRRDKIMALNLNEHPTPYIV